MLSTSKSFFRKPGGGATPTTDPSFAYVPLLLNTGSTNGQQNNTFLDSSTNNFTITRNGTPTQGSITPYWPNGQWSNYFNGSNSYVSTPNATSLQLNSSAWTIEGWFYVTSAAGTDRYLLVQQNGTLDANINWFLRFTTANVVRLALVTNVSVAVTIDGTTTVNPNTWYHIAASCDGAGAGANLRLWVNGIYQGGTTFNSAQLNTNAASTTVMSWPSASLFTAGYVSNVRIIKGTALYTGTGAITVPTTPLTPVTNTSLLTCQSNRFLDTNTQLTPKVITPSGTPTVQAFQPFSPAASYSAATYAGSGYFSTSNYLTAPASTSWQFTADHTIEAWIYLVSIASNGTIYGTGGIGADDQFTYESTGRLFWAGQGTAAGVITTNQWLHVAAARSGTTLKIFVNGVTQLTATVSGTIGQNLTAYIARRSDGDNQVNGYISNLRIVKGVAIYTANFTPPTTPVTNTAQTSLLLNMANAGIYDAAAQNNAITVGDAQASTTQSKWPPTSMKFDGTGDIISAPASQGFVFNGNLTVEGWVWIDSTMASSRPDNLKTFIFTGWNTGNTPQFFCYGTTTTAGIGLGYYDGTNSYQVAATVPKDQWVYVAFVRNGTTIYGYVNGTQYTITTSYSSVIGSLSSFVIGGNPNQASAYYSYLKGYIQDLRVTNGVARTITTPTAAFPTR